MRAPLLTLILLVAVAVSLGALIMETNSFHLPGNQQGYAPAQPIAFSHLLHAGELRIDCRYCHFGAAASRHASIPAESVCMNCHKIVTARLGAVRAEDELAQKEGRKPRPVISPELQKLYSSLALDAHMARDPAKSPKPIEWVQVHRLPAFAYFDHRAHVAAGLACQHCHGAIETIERVYQVEDLSMGWCVNCHRQVNQTGIGGKPVEAPTDCVACHH